MVFLRILCDTLRPGLLFWTLLLLHTTDTLPLLDSDNSVKCFTTPASLIGLRPLPLRSVSVQMAAARKCCVPNCGADNEILHKFSNPDKEPDRFRTWIYKVGGDILDKDNLYIYNYRKICHLHFEDQYLTRSKKLSANAIPTLRLSGAIHQPTITSMLPESASKSFTDKVKSGEIKMACFLAEHNLPFSLADDLKDLIQTVAQDSNLASELTFGRTKAHAIVVNVTGKVAENKLIETLQKNKFSLIVDESTDRSSTKHLALIVRTAVDFHVERRGGRRGRGRGAGRGELTQEVSVSPGISQNIPELQRAYGQPIPVTKALHSDLMSLCKKKIYQATTIRSTKV